MAASPRDDIIVNARVGSVVGIDNVLAMVVDAFDDHQIPLKVTLDQKELKAQVMDVQRIFKNIAPKGSPMKQYQEQIEAVIRAGESLYKMKMHYVAPTMSEDVDGNMVSDQNGYWKVTKLAIQAASDEMKKYYAESEKIIGKMSKSIGNPKEMQHWIGKLKEAKAAIIEFGDVMDAVEMNAAKTPLEKDNIRRYGSKLATKMVEDIGTLEDVQSEKNNAVIHEKETKGLERLKNAYIEYFEVVNNKSMNANLKKKLLKEKNDVIVATKESIRDLYTSIGRSSGEMKEATKVFDSMRQNTKRHQKKLYDVEYANEQSKLYLNTLNEINRVKLNISKAEATLKSPETKKPETAAVITALRQEEKALEKKATTQKKAMIQGGLAKQEAELAAEAQRKYTIELAKFESKGKAQLTMLEDMAIGFKKAAARVINYTVVYRSLWFAIGLGKDAIRTIKELNEAMVNIRMITGTSVQSNMELMESYNKLAIQLGATTAEVSRAAIEYLRQGRSVAETNQLIEASMVLSKVGFIDSAAATEYLTSTMNGYKMSVSEVMRIVDAMSQVDVKAATSVQELAVALQRSANSGRNAGVEFERLLGYVGSVSETTRRSAETIGEAFKTMFARMQNIKVGKFVDDETDEPLNDVEKALNKLNISLRTSENLWRPLGDVLDDINGKWDNLNQTERSAVAVSIAGIRQREIFLALMDSYDRALVLEQEALNSSGAAMKKYEAYQDGIAAAQNRLKSTFEGMVFTQFNQSMYKLIMLDVPKVFLDIAKALKLVEIGVLVAGVTLFGLGIDRLKLAWVKLTHTMAFYQNIAAINSATSATLTSLTEAATVSTWAHTVALQVYNKEQLRKILIGKGVSASLIEQILAQDTLKFATLGGAKANGIFTASLSALKAAMLANPYMWLAIGGWAFLEVLDALTTSMEEQVEIVQELTSELKDLETTYINLRDKSSLNKSEELYLSLLERQIELRKESLRLAKEELFVKSFRQPVNNPGRNANIPYGDSGEIVYVGEDDKRSVLKKNMQDLYDLYKKLNNPKLDEKQYDKLNKQLIDLESNYASAVIALMEARDAGILLNDAEEELVENYTKFIEQYKKKTSSLADEISVVESTALAISNASKSVSEFKDEIGKLSSLLDEFNEAGELSAQTVLDLASENSNLLEYITLENGQYKLNADALKIRFELLKANTLADLYAQQAMFKNTDTIRSQRDAYINLAMATQDATQAAVYMAMVNSLNKDVVDNSGWDTLQNTINLIKGITFDSFVKGAEKSSTAVDKLQAKIDKLNKTLKEQEDLLDTLKDRNEAILDAIIDVIEKEIEALEKQKEESEKFYDDQIDAIKESIDLIKEQADEEDRLLALEEKRLDVIKKQQALTDVLAQKNTRVYKTGLGWVFDADPTAVKGAEDDLAQSQKDYDEALEEYQRDQLIKSLEDQIKSLEDAKKTALSLIDDQIKALKELKEQWSKSLKIETDLSQYKGALEFLAGFEAASYASRLSMLESFQTEYRSQYNEYMAQINATKSALAELEKQQDSLKEKNEGKKKKVVKQDEAVDPAIARAEEDAAKRSSWGILVDKVKQYYTSKDYDLMEDATKALDRLLASDPLFYSPGINTGIRGWERYQKFKQGGPVSYTGPAMVHGTPSNPEFMLNAKELPVVKNLFAKMGIGGGLYNPKAVGGGSSQSFIINELNVSAPNEATIETILQSAMMLAKTGRG